ncbi:hypothetical protein Patl1_29206 [Pistacia atlantica]|uniref:Uncharacterized protein n=1 Tax=Pistacia atlantica TaxID=434234 RepID=A0ACC1BD74_9ROSI|nr:hypothetical protein Patl1_29206 [Pistacia atlantica]
MDEERRHWMKPNWTLLPLHILSKIGERLESFDDHLRFRSVCKTFQMAIPSPIKTVIPTKVRNTSFPFYTDPTTTSGRIDHFLLTESTIFALEPRVVSNPNETSQSWFVNIERTNIGTVRIKDPLGGFRYRKLPNDLPRTINLLDYRIREITKGYRLELATSSKKNNSRVHMSKLYQREPTIFFKVAVSRYAEKFSFLAIHNESPDIFRAGDDDNRGKLVGWKEGNEELTVLDVDVHDVVDVIYHDNKFYAQCLSGPTLGFDAKTLEIVQVTHKKGTRGRHFFVESSENLFLVNTFWDFKSGSVLLTLQFYEHNGLDNDWVPMKDGVGDRVLFLGSDFSFSVSAKEFLALTENTVYFTYEHFLKPKETYPGMNANIVYLTHNITGLPPAFPDCTKIFWPPPTWVLDLGTMADISSSASSSAPLPL